MSKKFSHPNLDYFNQALATYVESGHLFLDETSDTVDPGSLLKFKFRERFENLETNSFRHFFDATSEPLHLDDETQSFSEYHDKKALLAEAATSQSEIRLEFLKQLEHLIRKSEFEFGFNTPADDYVRNALKTYGVFPRAWLNELFLRLFNKPSELSGLLRVIAHFEYHEISPEGPTMAVAALSHKDPDIRECGIRCFENWENASSIDVLENLMIPEPWLREYLSDVISDLKGLTENVTTDQKNSTQQMDAERY